MVTEEDVKKVAKLSMFELKKSETEMFRKHLESILVHVNRLNELETEGVEPTTYILPQQNIMREDIPRDYGKSAELLSVAPEKKDGSYIVPQVVD